MDKIGRGIIAGFLATIALSAMLDPIAMLVRSAGILSPTLGWLLHFLVGTLVWGAGFALVHDWLRGPSWLRGILFGVGAWLLVVITVVAMRRFGLFGFDLGFATPLAMLAIHVVFGALLGGIYDLLGSSPESKAPRRPPARPHDDLGADENWHPLPR
jgi:Family of unknown function (DUF6789)